MPHRSGRLSSRRSGGTEMLAPLPKTPRESDGKRFVEELGEPSMIQADAPERRDGPYNGNNDDENDDDHDNDYGGDAVEYTKSQGKKPARAVATPVSLRKTRGSVAVTIEDSDADPDADWTDLSDGEEGFAEDGDFDPEESLLDECEAAPEEQDVDPNDEDDDNEPEEFSNAGDSKRPAKKARISAETAEQWIHDYNQANPVDENDPDVQRFQKKLRAIVHHICTWARENENGSLDAWYRSPAHKRHMTKAFREVLQRADIQELVDKILAHMPDQVQKIFGKLNLTPTDLLELPEVPYMTKHRLVYTNVPVRVSVGSIERARKVGKRRVKSLKRGTSLQSVKQTKIYIGSTIAKKGGYARIRCHERGSDGIYEKRNMHYDYTEQEDVVPNFRVIALWSNPECVDSLNPEEDIERWLVVFLEGIMMLYLGTISRYNKPAVDKSSNAIFAEEKYVLVDMLRDDLDLPEFHDHSLNQAWPLAQGVNGGMVRNGDAMLATLTMQTVAQTEHHSPCEAPIGKERQRK
ncbi:hypothetical protein NW752_005250 [Fusarium irregulare]|nr:hypothetical protein NW752_005250 [Fusarium irregulare]